MSLENFVHKTIIIIVTYNAMPWIQKCLDSCGDFPVLVIDNASTDGTPEQIEQEYPNVTLFRQHKNLGFGQANNIGMTTALELGADAVFLLNQDAYLQVGCIEKLIEVHKSNPDYGILSPVHLNGSGDSLDVNFSRYVSLQNSTNFYSDFILKKPLQAIYEVPFVNAAGWYMPKAVLEAVGGFDPIFFHYGEDDNYCQRVQYHGYKIGVVPIAFLWHDRENRIPKKIEKGTTAFFERLECTLKIKYGNINLENLDELKVLIKKRKRNLYKAYLKLNLSQVNFFKKELKIYTTLLTEIRKSKQQNKQRASSYLKTS